MNGGNRSRSKFSGTHNQGKVTGLHSQTTGKLSKGPGKLGSGSRSPAAATTGKAYRDQMAPTSNTTPTTSAAPSPTQTGKGPSQSTLPRSTLVNKGKLPWIVRKGIDIGITTVLPIYGVGKTVYDTGTTLGPGVRQTLENSRRSQEKREQDIKAAEEAGKLNQEQGGGFLGGGLKSVDLNDP